MSVRIAKLEGLLARVRSRGEEPRALASAESPSELADDLDLDAPAPKATGPTGELDDIDDIDVDEFDDEVDLDEPGQPESGQVAATTMDDAIEAAEHQPPITPPPESGEGIANPQIPAYGGGPTMEQLGETIHLEEGGRQSFELDEPILDEPVIEPPPSSRMEAELSPSAPPAVEHLSVPDNAREELDRMRLGDSTPVEARVSKRPVISTNVVELVTSSRAFEPKSFLQLVDSSLALK